MCDSVPERLGGLNKDQRDEEETTAHVSGQRVVFAKSAIKRKHSASSPEKNFTSQVPLFVR